MSSDEFEVALLLADITGSTPLYEKVGDAAALGHEMPLADDLAPLFTSVEIGRLTAATLQAQVWAAFTKGCSTTQAVQAWADSVQRHLAS